jgi:hydrogenase maturation protein HypF
LNSASAEKCEIRVRGRVQGVGFRPFVWIAARDLGLAGEVFNDAEGVLIRVAGPAKAITELRRRLRDEAPSLAKVESVEMKPFSGDLPPEFRIHVSREGRARTQISPDAKLCAACAADIADPANRRFRYPFTTCTHCGPRFSIVKSIPYDRANTTMAAFALCADCAADYGDPVDRRYHAQPIACPVCGPRARLVDMDGSAVPHTARDDVEAASQLIQRGEIVAIKGLGGYHIACDATNAASVARLRQGKRRDGKPLAMMARDCDVIRRFARVGEAEAALLASPEAPIVILPAAGEPLPEAIAPGLSELGFLLPTTPLHALLMRDIDNPVVMTSGNLSHEPQLIDDVPALAKLKDIADCALVHDRPIANRIDDSVARSMDGALRLLRRARGYAPAPLPLPPGFAAAPELLAFGAELKSTFCLVKDGEAILSQHQGDLHNAETYDDYARNLRLYMQMFQQAPTAFAVDRHRDMLSSTLGAALARENNAPLIEIQHHHAHVAACLAENLRALDAPRVLGVVLDGLGLGEDGAIWGGEFLLADYRGHERVGSFKPVAMIGGDRASREPWRNLYAHLTAAMDWPRLRAEFGSLPLLDALDAKPRATLDAMVKSGLNAPLASSCGRLFDAMAAALGLGWDAQSYEGEAAMKLEALAGRDASGDEGFYPLSLAQAGGLPIVEPLPLWRAVLGDLVQNTPRETMAARFHRGLAQAVVAMTVRLADREGAEPRFDTVALSGGCFQNRILFEHVARALRAENFAVLTHQKTPANDGGLALGQAVIAAATLIAEERRRSHNRVGAGLPFPWRRG